MLRFLSQDSPAMQLPPLRTRKLRAECSQAHKCECFPQQMRVRREVGGEIALDMASVQSQGAAQVAFEIGGKSCRNREKMVQPKPGKRTKRDFKAASPIHAERIRIGALPRVPLCDCFARVMVLMCELPGFGQSYE